MQGWAETLTVEGPEGPNGKDLQLSTADRVAHMYGSPQYTLDWLLGRSGTDFNSNTNYSKNYAKY
jgi:hypothetical protein